MIAIKLRVSETLAKAFSDLHPAYGERSRVFNELLEAYVFRAKAATIHQVQKEVINETIQIVTKC
jgi:hypothetical protein